MYGNVNRKKKKDGTLYKDYFYYACKHRRLVDGHKCGYRKPQSPSLITEKRPRPGPKGRNRVAFNYECCNYIFIAVSLLAGSSQYTLVSGPHGPLTRRYAPTSGKPSSGPLRPRTEALSWLKAGMVWQGWGWVR